MTRKISKPLHTGMINNVSVRFFRSPLTAEDARPDFHWVALKDIEKAFGHSQELIQKAQRHYSRKLITVATENGIDTIVPHGFCEGLMNAAVKSGHIEPAIQDEYYAVAMAVGNLLMANLSNENERAIFLKEASDREN